MPLFDFKCRKCSTVYADVFVRRYSEAEHMTCRKCGAPLSRMIPLVHGKVGVSVDSRDPGKVTKEKNEQLKKANAGYKHEERNLREDIARRTREKLK